MRRSSWKQETPRDQLVVILGSVYGNLLNLQDGDCKDPKVTMSAMQAQLEEVQELLREIPKGEWV